VRFASALSLVLLLAGCASAPTRVYTLTSVPAAHSMPVVASRMPIEVGEIPVPASVDRSSIVLYDGDDRLSILANDEWAAPLGSLIRQALTADLQSHLGASVLAPGAIAPAGRLRILSLTIEQFIGSSSGRVVLNASWALLAAGTSHVIDRDHELITVEAGSGKVADIVPAMSQALGLLAAHIAQRIAA
jgi:uncharacterized protein